MIIIIISRLQIPEKVINVIITNVTMMMIIFIIIILSLLFNHLRIADPWSPGERPEGAGAPTGPPAVAPPARAPPHLPEAPRGGLKTHRRHPHGIPRRFQVCLRLDVSRPFWNDLN